MSICLWVVDWRIGWKRASRTKCNLSWMKSCSERHKVTSNESKVSAGLAITHMDTHTHSITLSQGLDNQPRSIHKPYRQTNVICWLLVRHIWEYSGNCSVHALILIRADPSSCHLDTGQNFRGMIFLITSQWQILLGFIINVFWPIYPKEGHHWPYFCTVSFATSDHLLCLWFEPHSSDFAFRIYHATTQP